MFTLPNLVTFFRLVLIPAILYLSATDRTEGLIAAALLFALAAASDWLDGYLARRLGARSRLGMLMDPLVDKAMILGVLIVFAGRNLLPWWLVLLNVFRESVVTVIRYRASSGRQPVGANWMGKTKFCVQVGVLELAYLHLILTSRGGGLIGGAETVFWLVLGVTVVSYLFALSLIHI